VSTVTVAGPATAAAAPQLLSLSELARTRKRDKALISRQVKKLVAAGKLETREGERGEKLIDPAAFARALGEIADPVKVQAAATARHFRAPESPAGATKPQPGATAAPSGAEPTLSGAQLQKIHYEAELKKLDLAERRGLIVPIADIIAALRAAGDAAVQLIDRLPLRSADLTEAVGANGEAGARALLKTIAFELRTGLAEAFAKLETQGKAEEAAGPLAADLPDEADQADQAP